MEREYYNNICTGECHKCSKKECENHPNNYDNALLFASNFIFAPWTEEYKMLEKMMNSKLNAGLLIMSFENEECYYARDYELSDKEKEIVKYADTIIKKIEIEVSNSRMVSCIKMIEHLGHIVVEDKSYYYSSYDPSGCMDFQVLMSTDYKMIQFQIIPNDTNIDLTYCGTVAGMSREDALELENALKLEMKYNHRRLQEEAAEEDWKDWAIEEYMDKEVK